jgi:DNA modification methylase
MLTSAMERWLNKIHCGDCVTLLDKIPAGSVGLIVTSPPYNLLNSTGDGMTGRRSSAMRRQKTALVAVGQ